MELLERTALLLEQLDIPGPTRTAGLLRQIPLPTIRIQLTIQKWLVYTLLSKPDYANKICQHDQASGFHRSRGGGPVMATGIYLLRHYFFVYSLV
jgi:hypothetical protein